jgi:hypothetical protein
MPQPHLILIGGFLGAGKTTAIVALARWLGDQGIRAGFVTHNQGEQLVDTGCLHAAGLDIEEMGGGKPKHMPANLAQSNSRSIWEEPRLLEATHPPHLPGSIAPKFRDFVPSPSCPVPNSDQCRGIASDLDFQDFKKWARGIVRTIMKPGAPIQQSFTGRSAELGTADNASHHRRLANLCGELPPSEESQTARTGLRSETR